jgi:uracil-DNA glycosylase
MTSIELLKSLRSLVVYHRSCGLDHYHRSDALNSCLGRLELLKSHPPKKAQPTSVPEAETKSLASEGPGSDEQAAAPLPTLEALAAEIATCRICPLHRGRKISTPGTGGSRPRLLIIGDWLIHDTVDEVEEAALFGLQQDRMLAKMMAAIELKTSQVFVTNVIKCSVDASLKPDPSHIGACLSYLKQQISVLTPQLICTMGAAPSQALLGSTLPLIRLRGRFHRYRAGNALDIPVMPTFHPSFLLKNPEMKQSTWGDLQAIRKKLQSFG